MEMFSTLQNVDYTAVYVYQKLSNCALKVYGGGALKRLKQHPPLYVCLDAFSNSDSR